ncbi:MAG: hypothetical protein J6V23_09125 [Bacteroidaceae bacterium]|nr:hypothetical protein [Bacteroidaceae bacterium]MBO7240621.1 hypothetical protein [Bacteroidaceae bacterium]
MIYNLIVFLILLAVNVFAGLLFSGYEWQSVCYTSAVLLVNFIFVQLLLSAKIKDAFKISLSFIFSFFGIIEFVLAAVADTEFADNYCLMGIVGLVVVQILLFLIVNLVSQKVD